MDYKDYYQILGVPRSADEKTIKKHKPKLAISAYHRPDDLYRIPKFLYSLREDYKLFLDYYTIIGDEIILYCI